MPKASENRSVGVTLAGFAAGATVTHGGSAAYKEQNR
jgi:hypothetical protein